MTRIGMLGNEAARHCGTSFRTVQREMERDPEFAKEVMYARGEAREKVEQVLLSAALAGEPWAVKKWLESHDRETYGKFEKHEVVQKTTTELEVGERLAKITEMKERLAIAAAAEEREAVELERTDD